MYTYTTLGDGSHESHKDLLFTPSLSFQPIKKGFNLKLMSRDLKNLKFQVQSVYKFS